MEKFSYPLIVLLILAVLMTGCIEQLEGTEFATYTNNEVGVSIQYPSTWSKEEINSAVYFRSPLGPALVLQYTANVGQGLDAAVYALQVSYETMPDYQEIYDNPATITGLQAREFEIKATQEDIPVKAVTIVAEGTYFYAITYAAPEALYGAYMWVYDKAKETFTITQLQYECGDGVCETDKGESYANCPQDCNLTYDCGNGICETALGENVQNCPSDCLSGNGGTGGDGQGPLEERVASTIIQHGGTATWGYLYVGSTQALYAVTLDSNTNEIWLKWKTGPHEGEVAAEWDSIDIANLEPKTLDAGCYLLGCTGLPSCDAYVGYMSTMDWDPTKACPV